MSKFDVLHSDEAPKAVGPYSQALIPKSPGLPVYLSGQVGLDPQTGKLVEGGIEAETRQVLKNVSAVLRAAGLDLSDITSVDVLLADIGDWLKMNAIYSEEFAEHKPARAAYAVSALPLGAKIEIKATAWKPNEVAPAWKIFHRKLYDDLRLPGQTRFVILLGVIHEQGPVNGWIKDIPSL